MGEKNVHKPRSISDPRGGDQRQAPPAGAMAVTHQAQHDIDDQNGHFRTSGLQKQLLFL
jgi:hypothetical protein